MPGATPNLSSAMPDENQTSLGIACGQMGEIGLADWWRCAETDSFVGAG